MDQEFLNSKMNYEIMSSDLLKTLKDNFLEYEKTLQEKLENTKKNIEIIDNILLQKSKPTNVEFGVSSINSEEIVKYN